MNSRVRWKPGLLLAGVQAALMLSTGLLFWFDRQTSPRAWVPTAPVDPNLPIRGRYITLNMVAPFVPTRDQFHTTRASRVRVPHTPPHVYSCFIIS